MFDAKSFWPSDSMSGSKRKSSKVNTWDVANLYVRLRRLHINGLEDKSILATGDFKKADTYVVDFDSLPAGVTGLQLEAIPDETLAKRVRGGLLRRPIGDFFLSEVTVSQNDQVSKDQRG